MPPATVVPDPYGFPGELCTRAVPFIALYGLEAARNPTHKFIWDAFTKNPLPINLNILPVNHQFPTVKPKKGSYDRYIPKGILKRNWIRKHLGEIPAAVALFMDLNWDDPNWETHKQTCIHQVNHIKDQLGGLGTKLAVILIQRVAPLPAGEDARGAERAALLCAACDLPPKQLYVVPQDDHLQGYVLRLQNALLELAKSYYAQEIKSVKSHKDYLNKTTHRYLYVRHCFKMAFLCELKMDDRSGRNLYENAYTHIKEVRPTDTNLHELKLVAGFINYKLCSVMFRLNEPRDALHQFKNHVKLYKPWVGPQPLLFEHYAWLAVQYAAFADLFDDAIRQGLSAMQTEHPGLYYRQAALYTIERKLTARELCTGGANAPLEGLNAPLEGGEFWGQRGWRPGKLAAEPLDPEAERLGVEALQNREAAVDHSALIIGYLGNAISQFKTYRCPRMRLQLLVQMAEEYHAANDHGKALTLLSHMLWDYRKEKWWSLLSAQLQLGISSSFLSTNVQDFITFSVEALGPHIPTSDPVRLSVYQNLMAVLNGEVPSAPYGETSALLTQALSCWSTAPRAPITVKMADISTCLSVQVVFTQAEYPIGQPITCRLQITSHCPGPIQIASLRATVASDAFSQEMESHNRDVIIVSGSVGVFECTAVLPVEPGRKLSIAAVSLCVGRGRPVTLQLAPTAAAIIVPKEFTKNGEKESTATFSTTCIACPKADVSMEITHFGPALLGEQFPVNVRIRNDDVMALYHPVLEVKLISPGDDASPDASTRLSDEKETSISPRSIKVLLDAVAPATAATARVFLKGYSTGDRSLAFILTYNTSDDVTTPGHVTSAVEQQTTVGVAKPFEVSYECVTTKLQPAGNCYAHEPFLLCADVLVTAPCPITVRHSTLELGLFVANECQKPSSQLAGTTLQPGDTGRDIFSITLTEAKPQPVAVGTYVLQWSREGSSTVTSSSITLPAIRCLPSLVSVSMTLPAHGRVRTPMAVAYKLYNRTSSLLQLQMHVDASEAFMFAGERQAVLRLLPESERILHYNLYPLLSGLLALPKLVLTAPDLTDQLSTTLQRNLPSHVYVMPQEKNTTSAGL